MFGPMKLLKTFDIDFHQHLISFTITYLCLLNGC